MIKTIRNTMLVLMVVSFRVGQVTLVASCRTSRINWDAFVSDIRFSPFTSSVAAGRSGGTRTHNPRFWRPVLYQLSYTPNFATAANEIPWMGAYTQSMPVWEEVIDNF